jgi:hypothetical protein
MEFYQMNVIAFVLFNSFLAFLQHRSNGKTKAGRALEDGNEASVIAAKAMNWQFKLRFLPVYLLVFGADWLQVSN